MREIMELVPDARVAGQRRLLALDGGGIRGVLSLEVLSALETKLRAKYKKPDLVLSDFFDYFAGTSTGAMIASGLALGWPVERLMRIYTERGPEMFETLPFHKRVRTLLGYRFPSAKLAAGMREEYGADTYFGDADFKSLLLVVMHNANTDSAWPLSNNPLAKYNAASRDDCNLRLPLWEVVRASTAAPLIYPPEPVTLGGRDFVFVDGAITPYNNPAFQLYTQATLPEYRLCWPTGVDKMLVVSVGTGMTPNVQPELRARDMHALYTLKTLPGTLLGGAVQHQDLSCRTVGHCVHGAPLDREIGNLSEGAGVEDRKFTYARYNATLTIGGLEELGLSHLSGRKTLAGLHRVAGMSHINELREVGRAVGRQVSLDAFSNFEGVATSS